MYYRNEKMFCLITIKHEFKSITVKQKKIYETVEKSSKYDQNKVTSLSSNLNTSVKQI